ncbi:hypothetical protein I317_03801 [Kwoniella heveanensis CBS 569]|uniref:Uncharacterized protein n=1 Tax=Kwoniella heveanensis BCC8398 TaxID=1296120 RepID=A0A1B9GUL3_9TREE|nr:hypothetical protein I316_03769 [Kwoniella heveanensis BCC8398]OCF42426.1 hypothetical protein I317_03801 [Kwoniella heveanensis CBS 569]
MRVARTLTAALRASLARPVQLRSAGEAVRALHSTPRSLASETPKDPFADPAFKAFQEKVKNHQGAIDAITTLGEIMKTKAGFIKSGFDTTTQPSMTQMAKMAMDKDLRAAAQNLMAELQKAGVDPKEAMEMFQKANSGGL